MISCKFKISSYDIGGIQRAHCWPTPGVALCLLDLDQKQLADKAGVSVQTIQRMEASDGIVRGVVETLMKVVDALDRAGIRVHW